ncbi:MAG: HD domain-containing protein [Nanoarchaeota archaeon]|nr:HD domain-containing protein [Nanoarchaeota archaeon]
MSKKPIIDLKKAEAIEGELLRTYGGLIDEVRRDHVIKRKDGGGHHDLFHTVRVARTALCIALNEDVARLAWIAGMLHNTDRLFGKKETPKKLRARLKRVRLNNKEKTAIIKAVLTHDQPNDPKDDEVATTLKDADRIADAGAMHLIRGSQWFSGLQVCLLEGPGRYSGATFPKARAVTDIIHWFFEWESDPRFCLRLPKARQIGKRGFDFLRSALKNIEEQQRAIGMYPLPKAVKKIIGDYTN